MEAMQGGGAALKKARRRKSLLLAKAFVCVAIQSKLEVQTLGKFRLPSGSSMK